MPRPPRRHSLTPVQRILAASGRVAALLTMCAQPTLALAQQKDPAKALKEAEAAQQQAAQQQAEVAAKEAASKQAAGDGRVRAQPATPAGQTGAATNPTGAQPAGGGRPAGATGAQGPAGAQPARPPITVSGGDPTGAASSQPKQPLKPDEISLTNFAEGIDLKLLVEFVADTLQINVIASDTLQGTVVLNAPVIVKKSELLGLLDALLEQHGFTIIPDNQTGFYKVLPLDGITVAFESDHATTRVIPTPTVRPSSLSDIINTQMGIVSTATPGQPGGGGGGGRGRITYLDDLGVIVVTDSPRRIETLVQFVNLVLARAGDQLFIRFNLEHLAASVARTRILELVGKTQQQTNMPPQGVAPQAALNMAMGTGNLDNLSDRLIADAQSNALILRGYPEEEARIKTLLAILDKPNSMEYKQYFAGSAALQIAQLAERFGFGTTETVETAASQNQQSAAQPGALRQQPGQINPQLFGQQSSLGGPVLVVDPSRGAITYNGTASQQTAFEKLIASFNPQLEIVEFRAYKIKNMPAPDMADLLHGLIFNEEVAGRSDTSSPFLSGSGRGRGSGGGGSSYRDRSNSRTNRTSNQVNNDGTQTTRQLAPRTSNSSRSGAGGTNGSGRSSGPVAFNPANPGANQPSAEGVGSIGGNDVFLLADEANNQVVVKATARDHQQIAKLIDKLDQRRPQVYIEVQIVSVSATDDFRLAFEVQGINAGGAGGVVNTNFGLGTFAGTTTGSTTTPGSFVGPKSVVTTLAGMTAAVVRSDQVPIIMTALKKNADTRILSSPQLLVDDNEFAEIVSLDEQPTTGSDIGTSTTQTSFTGYESAGTTLSVTPSISEGGYMRLEYEIELSNFVGTGANGVPPPKQTRNVSSSSVTIPGGATIVVGGIKVDAKSNTIVKVPLLGDIPILGALFRDTNKSSVNNRLYIFITPRIMRDVYGGDLSLLSKGPAAESGITPDTPELKPLMIDLNDVPLPSPDSAAATAAKREEQPEGVKP